MRFYIVLASIGAVVALFLIALNFSSLTGFFVQSVDNVAKLNLSTDEPKPDCPSSCDDNNPCTSDYCNKTTGYVCIYTTLNGSVKGCDSSASCVYNTCLSGKCVVVQKDNCCGNKKCESGEACYNCPEDCQCVTAEHSQPSQTQPTSAEPNSNNSEIQQPTANITSSTNITQSSSIGHIIISEIQIGSNEFVELYNPTSSDIDTTGWYLSYFSSKKNWNDTHRNWALPNVKLKSAKFFLINIYNTPDADWTVLTTSGTPYSTGQIAASGSIVIFPFNPNTKTSEEAKNGRIDAVGWGDTAYVYELSPSLAPDSEKSLERKSFTADTDNNSADFEVKTSPSPKNSINQ